MLGLPKITKFIRDCTYIPDYLLGVIVGIVLGDASLTYQVPNGNPRIGFKQSIINFPFF